MPAAFDSSAYSMDSWETPVTVADANLPDCPLIYANLAFLRLTGYDRQDVLGRNCRFLQNGAPQPEARRIGVELRRGQGFFATLLNFTAQGAPFISAVRVEPFGAPRAGGLLVGTQFNLGDPAARESKAGPYVLSAHEAAMQEIRHSAVLSFIENRFSRRAGGA